MKKVDFFVDDLPFDLKTTSLPLNFIDQMRRSRGMGTELSRLKQIARAGSITYDASAGLRDMAYEIAEKIRVNGTDDSKRALQEISEFRKRLLADCIGNPEPLLRNLYSQQGAMRFDASNRLFIILADLDNFDDSWKLKRNVNLLTSRIHGYLDGFSREGAHMVHFKHSSRPGRFSAMADAIFVSVGG